MDIPVSVLYFIIPIAFVVGLYQVYFAAKLDHRRVKAYVEQRGGRFISAASTPYGPGWFGANHVRIYGVRFCDYDGNEHEAFVKTSMWTGVYFTEDRIVRYDSCPVDPDAFASLQEDNAWLRAELDRLKGIKRDRGSDAIQESSDS
jgi:hypothetical protein